MNEPKSGMEVRMTGRLERWLFLPEEKVQRSAQIWHLLQSVLNAMQSAFLLFLVTRVCGDAEAGLISLAFSVAYLMITIGNYGVRNFQVTDLTPRFGFREYRTHRMVTCLMMMAASAVYILLRGYQGEKAQVVLLCCVLKLFESVENVYQAEFQRAGRLDVACKLGTFRFILCLIAFSACLFISRNLVFSLAAMNGAALVFLVLPLLYAFPKIRIRKPERPEPWYRLFISCFPLFLAFFLNIYICNASKYALDEVATAEVQGYYGMLFMPVFVINLISTCIYGPFLVRLAGYWNQRQMKPLMRFIYGQMIAIIGVGAIVTVFGYFWGIRLMSLFFGRDLNAYRGTLAVLLVGGGMTAIVEFMNNIITVIRRQKALIWIYGSVAAIALIMTGILVRAEGIQGAAWAYTGVLTVQAVLMCGYGLWCLLRTGAWENQEKNNRNGKKGKK